MFYHTVRHDNGNAVPSQLCYHFYSLDEPTLEKALQDVRYGQLCHRIPRSESCSLEMLTGKLLIFYLEYTFLKFEAKHIYQNIFFKDNF